MTTKKIINIKSIVISTLTNSDALPLRLEMDEILKSGGSIVLSFKGVKTISSSFLNSSIGEIIEKYGFENLSQKLSITESSKDISETIQKYIRDVRDLALNRHT